MKDSRIGTYGALALILSIALRSAALAALCAFGQLLPALVSWLAAGCLSRTFMVWHWSDLPPARLDGVASRVGAPDKSTARFALASGTVLTLALGCLALPVLPLLAAMLVAGLLGLVFTAHIRNRLGGHTGDTIGACQQLAEIAFLVSLAIGL
jgi:adenosylcobinamide-GDP ribazoletransferase